MPISKVHLDRLKSARAHKLARELAGLGYPGFAHLPALTVTNPATVLLEALIQSDIDVRIVEALPWVVLEKHRDVDWAWLIPEVTRRDAQNRLGFIVATARELADRLQFPAALEELGSIEHALERLRLDRDDTLCRWASMPAAEREWLTTTRSALARSWHVITGLTTEQLLAEERGNLLFSPAQARAAKIVWPDVDLIDAPDHDQEPPKS